MREAEFLHLLFVLLEANVVGLDGEEKRELLRDVLAAATQFLIAPPARLSRSAPGGA